MLPTEIQRIVLLIGLAATGYLMILAWNDDYIANSQPASYSEAPQPQQSGTTAAPAGNAAVDAGTPVGTDVPSVAEATASGAGSDVPDASLISGSVDAPQAAEPVAAVTQERLVKVTTDVLNVWIDRLGGDIVRVELPGYPVSIDRPGLPFLLLDNGQNQTYIAQSGLIGKDGIDSDGRPLFSAAANAFDLGTDDSLSVLLTTSQNGLDVEKVYEFRRGDYLVDVGYRGGQPEFRPDQRQPVRTDQA